MDENTQRQKCKKILHKNFLKTQGPTKTKQEWQQENTEKQSWHDHLKKTAPQKKKTQKQKMKGRSPPKNRNRSRTQNIKLEKNDF